MNNCDINVTLIAPATIEVILQEVSTNTLVLDDPTLSQSIILIEEAPQSTILVEENPIDVIYLLERGPQGLPGEDAQETLSWNNLVTLWSTPPTIIATTLGGSILSYIHQLTTRYRFVPSSYNSFEDAFYENWDGNNLTNLIVRRG